MTDMSEHLVQPRKEDLVGPLRLRLNGHVIEVSEYATSSAEKAQEYRRVGLAVDTFRLDERGIVLPEKQVDGPLLDQLADCKFADVASAIAADKAEQLYRQVGRPMLVGDVSLGVYAVPTVTGPNIKLWTKTPTGLQDLCTLATVHDTRLAIAIANLAIHDGETDTTKVWRASVSGQLAYSPRGDNGFGWDAIFMPEPEVQQIRMGGAPRTWAEMTPEEKVSIFPLRGAVVDELRKAVERA